MKEITTFSDLLHNLESEGFRGYDLYDGLKNIDNETILGNFYLREILTQLHKWSPINLRPLFLISPTRMPKAMGLILQAYCNIWHLLDKTKNQRKQDLVMQRMLRIESWLDNNKCQDYNGDCWNFGFKYKHMRNTPTVVITSIVARGLFNLYEINQSPRTRETLIRICNFIVEDLNISKTKKGICFSYTPITKDCTYNASLFGAEIIAKIVSITGDDNLLNYVSDSLDFVISNQHSDGHWNYSIDIESNTEREQIDFHQGYIIESLEEISKYLPDLREKCKVPIKRGMDYYKSQFTLDGRSCYRIPRIWPVDIHNQSQGIIVFSRSNKYQDSFSFSERILNWTIKHMLSQKGFFYYQKWPILSNRLNYTRWSQAWMLLAISFYLRSRYSCLDTPYINKIHTRIQEKK